MVLKGFTYNNIFCNEIYAAEKIYPKSIKIAKKNNAPKFILSAISYTFSIYILITNKYLVRRLQKTINNLKQIQDRPLDKIESEIKPNLGEIIDRMIDVDNEIQSLSYISIGQKRKLKKSFSQVIKSINNIDTFFHKKNYKNREKNDDTHLRNLVLHNNSLELNKRLDSLK